MCEKHQRATNRNNIRFSGKNERNFATTHVCLKVLCQLGSSLLTQSGQALGLTMASRSRLTPDPTIMVGDLQRCLFAFCKAEGSFDLQKLLLPSLTPSNWKSAAEPSYLAGPMGNLLKELFKVAPNGVIAGKKLKQALEKFQIDAHRRVNQSKLNDVDFWSLVDNNVRAAASQYRELKLSTSKYSTCMRKASIKEKEIMDNVLEVLSCKEENSSVVAEEKGNCGVQEAKDVETSEGPKNVYKRILAQKNSDASSPGKRYYKKSRPEPEDTQVPPGSAAAAEVVQPGSSTDKPVSEELAIPGSAPDKPGVTGGNAATMDTMRSLSLALQSKPWVSSGVPGGMDAKEVEELKGWMDTKIVVPLSMKKKKNSGLKKPAGVSKTQKTLKKPAASKNMASVDAKQTYKSTFRHRMTSSAYHAAKLHAKKMGQTEQEQLVAARAASSKMGADIDNGIIKEN